MLEEAAAPVVAADLTDVTRDPKAFQILVRNESFRVVRALASKRYDVAAEMLAPKSGETSVSPLALERSMAPYWEEHAFIATDAEARSTKHVRIEAGEATWIVEQSLLAEEGPTPFFLAFRVDVAASRTAGKPVMTLLALAR